MTAKPRRTAHLLIPDPDVPAEVRYVRGERVVRRTCTCGLPEQHPCHTLPDRPAEADSRELAAGDR